MKVFFFFKFNYRKTFEMCLYVRLFSGLSLCPQQGPQDVSDPDVVSRGSDPGSDRSPQLRHGREPPPESFFFKVHHLILDAQLLKSRDKRGGRHRLSPSLHFLLTSFMFSPNLSVVAS